MHIWQTLKKRNKPLYALAPMEEVTDTVFRQIILKLGKPDIFFTEFTSVEGIASVGQAKVIHRLKYTQQEQPLIAQLWGTTPEHYNTAAKLAVELGFVGLDINMGCPAPKVIKKGACSALINNPSLAKEIVQATKEGLNNQIPLSIKTRLGFGTVSLDHWIPFVLSELQPDALTVHMRTVKELSDPPAHKELISELIHLKNTIAPYTTLLINGDIDSIQEINEMHTLGADGGMVGRGIFHNPWIFTGKKIEDISPQTKLETLLDHTRLFVKTWESTKPFAVIKRFFKIYCNGFDGAKELRNKLMETKDLEGVENTIKAW